MNFIGELQLMTTNSHSKKHSKNSHVESIGWQGLDHSSIPVESGKGCISFATASDETIWPSLKKTCHLRTRRANEGANSTGSRLLDGHRVKA